MANENSGAASAAPAVTAVVRDRVRRGQEHVVLATAEQVAEARSWAADCAWEDGDELGHLTAAQVVRGVDRHYDGGWDQFLADGGWERC